MRTKDTYKAVEVSAPGMLRVVERPVSEPGAGQVRIRVEACGICHTDAATVTGTYPGLTLPRVPGHEVVGRIEALAERAGSNRAREIIYAAEPYDAATFERWNIVNRVRAG
jgi:D-arabinose 1-dehydrogenase-like Zn-dependent alcohol dehydrogenase